MDIVFEQPSEAALLRHQGTGGKYIDFAIALREYPDQWAVLPDEVPRTEKSAAGTAQGIRRGTTPKGFTKGEYDAVADGVKVYVKFTGANKDASGDATEPGEKDKGGGDDGDPERDPADPVVRPIRSVTPGHRAPPEDVRRWAQNNGLNVPSRGRMAESVWEAYARAQQKERVPGY